MKLSNEFTKREKHDEAFEQTYISGDQAITVERSSYEMVSNTHCEELANRETPPSSPGSPVGLPPWVQWFGNTQEKDERTQGSGFFNKKGWFWY